MSVATDATKHDAVSQALGFKHKAPRTWWWLKDESLVPLVPELIDAVEECGKGSVPKNVVPLRECARKTIFRLDPAGGPSLVGKACYLRTLRLKSQFIRRGFHYPKFGFDEGSNLVLAAAKGIPVPEVWGYGHVGIRLGIPTATVLLLEYLDTSPLETLIENATEEKQGELLATAIPLVIKLFRAGCHHVALKSDAIMMRPDGTDLKVLDLEHAKFYDEPSTQSLAFHAGFLAGSAKAFVADEVFDRWFPKVLDAADVPGGERTAMIERIQYYRTVRLSRRQREMIR